MLEISEDQALSRAAQGDHEAFGTLYERYVDRIYNYIYYRTGSTYDAEDLTERVFLRAMQHISRYKDRGLPFSAWLYRIAHNLVANWHRDNSRKKEIPLEDVSAFSLHGNQMGGELPEFMLVAAEDRERLLRVIRGMPSERQQLLIFKFVERLSNAEIGQIMGRSEGAVKSLYHRTLLSLRDDLEGFVMDSTGTKDNGSENQD